MITYNYNTEITSTRSSAKITKKLVNNLGFGPSSINCRGTYTSGEGSIQVDGNFDVSWARSQRLAVDFKTNYNHNQTSQVTDITTQFEVTTPFEGMKNNKLRLHGSIANRNEYKIDVDTNQEKEKAKLFFLLNKSLGQVKLDVKMTPSKTEPINFAFNLNHESASSYLVTTRADLGKGKLKEIINNKFRNLMHI